MEAAANGRTLLGFQMIDGQQGTLTQNTEGQKKKNLVRYA